MSAPPIVWDLRIDGVTEPTVTVLDGETVEMRPPSADMVARSLENIAREMGGWWPALFPGDDLDTRCGLTGRQADLIRAARLIRQSGVGE